MTIGRDTILRLESMSCIELTEAEREAAQAGLQSLIASFGALTALDTEGVEPMPYILPIANVTRADQAAPSMEPALLLANAPRQKDNCFMVHRALD